MEEVSTCVLCKEEFVGWGCNPEPLAEGVCCSNCDQTKVIPYRMALILDKKVKGFIPDWSRLTP